MIRIIIVFLFVLLSVVSEKPAVIAGSEGAQSTGGVAHKADFNGVWRLRGSSPPRESLVRVSETRGTIKLATFSQDGARYTLTDAEFEIGGERSGTLQRMPATFKARWEGDALLLEWTTTWPWGEQREQHRWVMDGAGKSFHDDFSDAFKTRVRKHSADFDREPEDRGKVFELPEQNSSEHFRNVQVLKDVPASALTPLMGSFQSALGVDCQYCHNQSAYDSDERKTKNTARAMITMMADLNRREFQGRPAVTCATCHRGKPTPVP